MSPEGRRRLVLSVMKVGLYLAALVCVGWTGWKIAAVFQDNVAAMPSAAKAVPITSIRMESAHSRHGVLTEEWLKKTLALPPGATLMEIDLLKLRGRLMENGQVLSANIERVFPSTLRATITERTPVARVKAQIDPDAPAKELIVARDGVVYEGIGYDSTIIDTLPWLDGIKLVKKGPGFAPIPDMPEAATLISTALLRAPHLYSDWQVVSLEKLASDRQIAVRTNTGLAIIFSTTLDYVRQLGRLDTILDIVKSQGDRPIRSIDLTLGSQVEVSYADAVPAPGAKTSGKPASALFSLPNRPKT